MPGIFDDERRGSGPIAPDPCGTGPISAKRIDNCLPDPNVRDSRPNGLPGPCFLPSSGAEGYV